MFAEMTGFESAGMMFGADHSLISPKVEKTKVGYDSDLLIIPRGVV